MTGANDLAKMVPGFEFLQGLMKNAGAALPGIPGMSQWIAPTLDPAEIEKRIQELKTVQFWLEQNARLLATTIQALEVQRMTLSTLQTMNLPLTDLRNALMVTPRSPAAAPEPARDSGREARAAARAEEERARADAQARAATSRDADADGSAAPTSTAAAPAIDPLQWWGALTQQFTEIAAKAVKDGAATAAAAQAAVGGGSAGTGAGAEADADSGADAAQAAGAADEPMGSDDAPGGGGSAPGRPPRNRAG